MSDIQHKIKYFDIKNGGFIYSFLHLKEMQTINITILR